MSREKAKVSPRFLLGLYAARIPLVVWIVSMLAGSLNPAFLGPAFLMYAAMSGFEASVTPIRFRRNWAIFMCIMCVVFAFVA